MAMTKKEVGAFEKMADDLRLAKALRWTEPVVPDVDIPSQENYELSTGWLYNAYMGGSGYSPRIEPACSSRVGHGFGRNDNTSSQGARRLFSTRLLALRACRADVEWQCAVKLAEIDRLIEIEKQHDS